MAKTNSSAADLEHYYARRAAEYEGIYSKPERQDDLARIKADLAQAFRARSVLEVACGTGYFTRHVAEHAACVDAYDINEETLAIARAKGLHPAHVRFALGDAYLPPAANPHHDAAFAGHWWSHVARRDLPRFLRGLHRVLSPGARVIFLDNRYVAGSSTPIARTDADGDTWQTRVLADGSSHDVLKNFPEAAELKAAIEPFAERSEVRLFDYYWWLDYTMAEAPR